MSPDAFIGEVCLFAGGNIDDHFWLPCDGRNLPVGETYNALYSLIGNAYGGVPNQNFNLPDLRGRVPIGMGQAASGTNYVLGQAGGSATATISMAQLPEHNHGMGNTSGGAIMVSSHAGASPTPDATNNTIAAAASAAGNDNAVYNNATPDIPWNTGSNPVVLSEAGSGAPFSIMQTYMAVGYYICFSGTYPSPQ